MNILDKWSKTGKLCLSFYQEKENLELQLMKFCLINEVLLFRTAQWSH